MSTGKVAPSAIIDDVPVRQNFVAIAAKPLASPPGMACDWAGACDERSRAVGRVTRGMRRGVQGYKRHLCRAFQKLVEHADEE